MALHIFADETKERGFLLAAACLDQVALVSARAGIARLVLRGQRSIHFCKERDGRRREILRHLRTLPVEVVLYDATTYRSVKSARDACLRALVADAAKVAAERLVLELDTSSEQADKRLLRRELSLAGIADQLRYDHLRAHDDHMLAIPDAVAWSWAKGGEWQSMVRPLVREVRTL
ncbi:hypothetical protein AWW66_27630 [Micromonospora rosaria]|uniref:DUF3800 domain-containing protein n=1 Tax=Micromonospora rosaria TaxID=47874 RepID=A0A136PK87_9ACTN|nr:hypothetical protein [Micromonospora rosaria]KXK58819.1 hypothetical protein AWW66_27630 [Micromonospora rosaria]